jgi:hypothetical protein
MKTLNDSNFLLYAAKYYDNPQTFDTQEFYEDLNRFKYIKRLFSRYKENGELRERLILNHLIVLFNVFGVEATIKMLFFKMEEHHWKFLKSFLVFLQCMPDIITNVGQNTIIYSSNIPTDDHILQRLRKI